MRTLAVAVTPILLVLPVRTIVAEGELEPPAAALVLGQPEGSPLQGERLGSLTEKVASLVRCPVCQGLSVADSPTDAAVAMKEEIRSLIARGYSHEQVLRYFESSYGEFIRLEPKAEGFNWAVWLAPFVAALSGVLLLRRYLTSAPPSRPAVRGEGDGDLEPYLRRVRREVVGP